MEKVKKSRKEINQEYYERNRDLIVEYRKRKRDPKKESERFKKWYEANREKVLEDKRDRYRRGE